MAVWWPLTVSWFPMTVWDNLIFFSENANLKCTQGSSCSTHQECGKNGSCNSKLGCKCGKKTKKTKKSKKTKKTNKPVPVKCIEDATCDVLGTEDDCPDGICYEG